MAGRGEAGLGRLKSAIYARMEEISFRSGAAAGAGVLAVAGVAITLAVALGGHRAAETSAPRSTAVARPPSPVFPAALPSAPASATPAASLTPAGGYQASAPVTAATTPQASASPATSQPTPRHPRPTPTPHSTGQPVPIVHNPGGLVPRGPAFAAASAVAAFSVVS